MSDPVFRYGTDAHGRPAAHAIKKHLPGLARFLTEEVTSGDYIDLLMDCAREAKAATAPVVNTGNAYVATFDGHQVSVEHLHVKQHGKETVPLAVFEQALSEWRGFIGTTSGG